MKFCVISRTLVGWGVYPSAEMQSLYFSAPAERNSTTEVRTRLVRGCSPLPFSYYAMGTPHPYMLELCTHGINSVWWLSISCLCDNETKSFLRGTLILNQPCHILISCGVEQIPTLWLNFAILRICFCQFQRFIGLLYIENQVKLSWVRKLLELYG